MPGLSDLQVQEWRLFGPYVDRRAGRRYWFLSEVKSFHYIFRRTRVEKLQPHSHMTESAVCCPVMFVCKFHLNTGVMSHVYLSYVYLRMFVSCSGMNLLIKLVKPLGHFVSVCNVHNWPSSHISSQALPATWWPSEDVWPINGVETEWSHYLF